MQTNILINQWLILGLSRSEVLEALFTTEIIDLTVDDH
jgi:hypothetical protein